MSQPVAICPSDTLETLEARVHTVEHDLYVRAIAHVLDVELRETVD
jgi:folate-dependent phosphoribosylglycinamide formyltransferase PurN